VLKGQKVRLRRPPRRRRRRSHRSRAPRRRPTATRRIPAATPRPRSPQRKRAATSLTPIRLAGWPGGVDPAQSRIIERRRIGSRPGLRGGGNRIIHGATRSLTSVVGPEVITVRAPACRPSAARFHESVRPSKPGRSGSDGRAVDALRTPYLARRLTHRGNGMIAFDSRWPRVSRAEEPMSE